jgi:hypothetical protein|eukprot:4371589-Prymnesium_polylepis.3
MPLANRFLCDPIRYSDTGAMRRYLHDDLDMSCDSEEYGTTRSTALLFIIVWPVGVPVLYFVLLWTTRRALISGIPTKVSRATAFLSEDYESTVWWWEPIDMARKLTLTGERA